MKDFRHGAGQGDYARRARVWLAGSVWRIIRADAARLTALTTLDAQARVIGHILTEHARQQSDLLHLPDRADWASQLGMSRETMSRILNGLAEGGMIELEKGGVRVINTAGLGRRIE